MLWLLGVVLTVAVASLAVPLVRRSYVTASLVLANLLLTLLLWVLILLGPALGLTGVLEFAFEELLFRPRDVTDLRLHTLVTAMFLHLSPFHLIVNVVVLYLLGLPLEDRIGGPAFAGVYVTTGLAASLLYAVVQWGSNTPALGASGAIMGIAGAFLALYPQDRIFFFLGPLIVPNLPVYVAVGVTLAGEAILIFFGVQSGIAHAAHMGGMGAGILAGPLFHRRGRATARAPAGVDLDELATTDELREVLARIRGESVAEVKQAWVDHFLEKARCPRCQGPLRRDGRTVRSACGWEREL